MAAETNEAVKVCKMKSIAVPVVEAVANAEHDLVFEKLSVPFF